MQNRGACSLFVDPTEGLRITQGVCGALQGELGESGERYWGGDGEERDARGGVRRMDKSAMVRLFYFCHRI